MKPFDLEKAKAGEPVVTRDGRPVRIVCSDLKSEEPVVGIVDYGSFEKVFCFSLAGVYEGFTPPNARDLFMASVKKEAWLNIYPDFMVNAHPTKEDAKLCADIDRVACIHIEWEE